MFELIGIREIRAWIDAQHHHQAHASKYGSSKAALKTFIPLLENKALLSFT